MIEMANKTLLMLVSRLDAWICPVSSLGQHSCEKPRAPVQGWRGGAGEWLVAHIACHFSCVWCPCLPQEQVRKSLFQPRETRTFQDTSSYPFPPPPEPTNYKVIMRAPVKTLNICPGPLDLLPMPSTDLWGSLQAGAHPQGPSPVPVLCSYSPTPTFAHADSPSQ